jgi:hypothetical protein
VLHVLHVATAACLLVLWAHMTAHVGGHARISCAAPPWPEFHGLCAVSMSSPKLIFSVRFLASGQNQPTEFRSSQWKSKEGSLFDFPIGGYFITHEPSSHGRYQQERRGRTHLRARCRRAFSSRSLALQKRRWCVWPAAAVCEGAHSRACGAKRCNSRLRCHLSTIRPRSSSCLVHFCVCSPRHLPPHARAGGEKKNKTRPEEIVFVCVCP